MVSSQVSVISQLSRIQPDAHRAGFGTASIGIRTSLRDQLMQDDFFHLSLQCVHPSHPYHGIAGFQPLGHTCIPGQLWHQQLHTPICRLVSFNQVRMEPLCQDEVAVQYGSALPQIPPPHTSVLTDRMQRLFRQLQLGNPIDANVGIGEPVHVSFLLMMFSQIAERFWFWIVALRGADVGN